eukprot:CAMPEP_0172470152 /NCGR_PEP_ID=MMETSP1065-20121228/65587_1 /TAXON_ID=265537 /ORGANISM="Amphiprora paludosa, Strain CCMP125" /LENGTH=239 /DNA_ID=CAMNT_0013228003 /DNA_START=37 /DNA_END=756 /DNA_ORIENTATION=+
MATAVRKRVFRRTVRQQTQQLDPVVRNALADDMAQDETDLEMDLTQIEAELEQAQKTLVEFQKKETFLGQRSRQYRLALDDRARQLATEQAALRDNDQELDVEATADLERRMEQWERDEDALTQITETHKEILAHVETMRRRIVELEHKRQACRTMAHENQDFLQAVQDHDHNEDDLDQAELAETELSQFVADDEPGGARSPPGEYSPVSTLPEQQQTIHKPEEQAPIMNLQTEEDTTV